MSNSLKYKSKLFRRAEKIGHNYFDFIEIDFVQRPLSLFVQTEPYVTI
jgi:hypothetical protein